MHPDYGRANIIPGLSFVVETITGRSGRVVKMLNNAVQVTVKQRGYELENWPWSWLTMRQPRLIKRYPRPFRFPREEKSEVCHCKIGKMEVIHEKEGTWEVTCTRCKFPIGTESFPRRVERATEFVRKASLEIPLSKVRQGVSRRPRKVSRRSKSSVKARRKSPRKLVVRPTRRSDAKKSNRKTRAKTGVLLPKRKRRTRPVSKRSNPPVSKTSLKTSKGKVKAKPIHVLDKRRAKKVPVLDKVDVVESVQKPDSTPDVRGPGSGGAADSSEVLPGVPGGPSTIH